MTSSNNAWNYLILLLSIVATLVIINSVDIDTDAPNTSQSGTGAVSSASFDNVYTFDGVADIEGLTFSYPSNWVVEEDPQGQALRLIADAETDQAIVFIMELLRNPDATVEDFATSAQGEIVSYGNLTGVSVARAVQDGFGAARLVEIGTGEFLIVQNASALDEARYTELQGELDGILSSLDASGLTFSPVALTASDELPANWTSTVIDSSTIIFQTPSNTAEQQTAFVQAQQVSNIDLLPSMSQIPGVYPADAILPPEASIEEIFAVYEDLTADSGIEVLEGPQETSYAGLTGTEVTVSVESFEYVRLMALEISDTESLFIFGLVLQPVEDADFPADIDVVFNAINYDVIADDANADDTEDTATEEETTDESDTDAEPEEGDDADSDAESEEGETEDGSEEETDAESENN